MTTVEVLRAARAKIADPANWEKGVDGGMALGNKLPRCAGHWLCAVCPPDVGSTPASDALRKVIGTRSIEHWNDDPARTHAEVLAAFDKAIAAEREASK